MAKKQNKKSRHAGPVVAIVTPATDDDDLEGHLRRLATKDKRTVKPKITPDEEIEAMRVIATVLEGRSHEEHKRMLDWLYAYYIDVDKAAISLANVIDVTRGEPK